MNETNALTLTNDNLVVFFFPCMANKLFPVAAGWRFHCALKFGKMKRSSTLSTLQNGSFRKGALRFSFCCFHITRRYLFEATHKQIFFHIVLITFPNFIGRSTCCLGANAFLFMFKYLSLFSFFVRQMVTQL